MCAPMWFYATSMQKALSHWEWMLGTELWSLERWEYFYSPSHLFTAILDSFFLAKNYFYKLQYGYWSYRQLVLRSGVCLEVYGLAWSHTLFFRIIFICSMRVLKIHELRVFGEGQLKASAFPQMCLERKWVSYMSGQLYSIYLWNSQILTENEHRAPLSIYFWHTLPRTLPSHSNGSFLEFLQMQADIISFNLIPNFDTNN